MAQPRCYTQTADDSVILQQVPSSCGRVAARISAPERDVMLGLATRPVAAAGQHRLCGRLAAHLERRLGIERPGFFSDEKFVLNRTAVVLGTLVGYGRDSRTSREDGGA